MSESFAGLSAAWTRQNAGRALNEGSGPRPPPGGVKSPAATVFADAIVMWGIVVVFGIEMEARLSQDAGALAAAAIAPVSVITPKIVARVFISPQYIR